MPGGLRRTKAPRSIRTRIAVGYAGIAALTAVLVGALLAALLPPFLHQLEVQYLAAAATSVSAALEQAGGVGPRNADRIPPVVAAAAKAELVTVRVLDERGSVIAQAPTPLAESSRSDARYSQAIRDKAGRAVGRVEVSEGLSPGSGIRDSILLAWALAGALAVAASATLGYVLASRFAEPITELAAASTRLAGGDLSVRATATGDAEIRHLASAFNEMADVVEGTVASLERFVSDAAHEIGTPLTALIADVELARDRPFDDSVPELLDRQLGHAERIQVITRDLLTLSRIEAAGGVSERCALDVGVLVARVVDGALPRAHARGVELVFGDPVERIVVPGDAAGLTRAVGNLVDNAIKYGRVPGRIVVGVERDGATAVIRVVDDGPGPAEDDVEHVFERFYRGRDTSSVEGSGLGLAIVKAVVDTHGGTVDLYRTEDSTVAEIRLPAGAVSDS